MKALIVACVVFVAACSGPANDTADVDSDSDTTLVQLLDRAYVLDDPAYRFCHEAGPYSKDLRPWCDLEPDVDPDRCPGFHELCARSAEQDVATPLPAGCASGGGTAPPTQPAGAPEAPTATEDWTPNSSCDAPETSLGWLGTVLGWLVAGVIALGVLVVLRVVIWAIFQRSAGRKESESSVPVEVPIITHVDDDEVPDVPSADLLHSADVALGEGRTADAILLARAAALRHLGDQGVVRLHRSRTDREYVRSVRRKDAIYNPLRTVVGWVERLRWGGEQATSDEARAVLSAVRKLVAATVMLLLVAGGLGADGTFRFGPAGDAAIADLFERAGYSVTWRLRSLETVDESTDVLIMDLAGIEPSDDDWAGIRDWVRDGGMVIVGGPAEVAFPRLGEPSTGLGDDALSEKGVQKPAFLFEMPDGWAGGYGRAVVYDPTTNTAFVKALPLGDGWVYAIGESSLLWNAALMAEDNEDFLLDLVGGEYSEFVSREDVHIQLALVASAGSDNPIETLWNARLLPLMLQIMAMMALAALWLGWPFAPLRDPERSARQRFSDHIVAMGGRYRRMGATDWVRRAYARWSLTRYGATGLATRAERNGKTHEQARAWVERVRALADGESPNDAMTLEELWKTTHQD